MSAVTLKAILAIAAGGALGAVGRHLLARWIGLWAGGGFPWGVLAVNVIGCLALGVAVELFAHMRAGSVWRQFLAVGVLGGFTTFSTFAMDVVGLAQRGQAAMASVYVGLSVGAGIAAALGGVAVARAALA